MKQIFLALTLLFSGTAAAETGLSFDKDVIAQYAVNLSSWDVDQHEQGMTWGIVKVKNNGALTVDKWLYTWDYGSTPEFKGTVAVELNPVAAQIILQNIISLNDAKTKTTYSEYVCMMMPAPGPNPALFVRGGYNYQSQAFSGKIRVLESNTGCWAHSRTSLEHDYDRKTAGQLMGQLQILAVQFAK